MDQRIVTGAMLVAVVMLLYVSRGWWLAPPPPRQRWTAVGSAVFVGVIMFATGWLLRPALPPPPWTAEWLPSSPDAASWDGELLSGGIGPLRLAPGPIREGVRAARLFATGSGLGVVAIAAPLPDGLAPLIVLYDREGVEVAVLAIDHGDLALRHRTRADEIGLRSPAVRVPGVMRNVVPGDTIRLAAGFHSFGRCFDVGLDRYCGIGPTGGSGWTLLADPHGIPLHARSALDGVWLALLALPVGFFAAPRLALGLLIALTWYGVIRLPVDTGLLPLPELSVLVLGAGVVLGMVMGGRYRKLRTAPPDGMLPEGEGGDAGEWTSTTSPP